MMETMMMLAMIMIMIVKMKIMMMEKMTNKTKLSLSPHTHNLTIINIRCTSAHRRLKRNGGKCAKYLRQNIYKFI